MHEQSFAYGGYTVELRSIELDGRRWVAEYRITHHDQPVQRWTTEGVDARPDETDAFNLAHRIAMSRIDAGIGIPHPHAFP